MLGHQLHASLGRTHEVRATLRLDNASYGSAGLFTAATTYSGVDVHDTNRLLDIVGEFKPQAIVNAVGIIKQRAEGHESIPSLEINSLLPHRLALIARTAGARLVHFSTDCVFSGRRGGYSEADVPDAEDVYGRTKLLGEVTEPHCITLRTSLIGHELQRSASLVEWFLSQRGRVRGFRRAIFSGFTTIEAARIVQMLLERYPTAHGVWHASSEPIDKYSLLTLVKRQYGLDTEIDPDDEFQCDRSLDSTRFRKQFDYQPPSWESMIAEMHEQWSTKQ
jgi:dTDP-4-dehydrorhamnose reductase